MSGKEMGCCRKTGLIGLRTHEAENSADDRQRYRGGRPGPSRSAFGILSCCAVLYMIRCGQMMSSLSDTSRRSRGDYNVA